MMSGFRYYESKYPSSCLLGHNLVINQIMTLPKKKLYRDVSWQTGIEATRKV